MTRNPLDHSESQALRQAIEVLRAAAPGLDPHPRALERIPSLKAIEPDARHAAWNRLATHDKQKIFARLARESFARRRASGEDPREAAQAALWETVMGSRPYTRPSEPLVAKAVLGFASLALPEPAVDPRLVDELAKRATENRNYYATADRWARRLGPRPSPRASTLEAPADAVQAFERARIWPLAPEHLARFGLSPRAYALLPENDRREHLGRVLREGSLHYTAEIYSRAPGIDARTAERLSSVAAAVDAVAGPEAAERFLTAAPASPAPEQGLIDAVNPRLGHARWTADEIRLLSMYLDAARGAERVARESPASTTRSISIRDLEKASAMRPLAPDEQQVAAQLARLRIGGRELPTHERFRKTSVGREELVRQAFQLSLSEIERRAPNEALKSEGINPTWRRDIAARMTIALIATGALHRGDPLWTKVERTLNQEKVVEQQRSAPAERRLREMTMSP